MGRRQNRKKESNDQAGRSSSSASDKKSASISSIFDKNLKSLPNIISTFRKARLETGYDEPAYFGFAIDIHSQTTEATNMFNPWTGLRANPLFYLPEWVNLKGDGSGITDVNDGENFSKLLENAYEACAIQYLNSFSLPLDKTYDELAANNLILSSAANSLSGPLRPGGDLNRGFYLMEFIKVLNSIQEKSPWTFKELDGIPNLWKATQPNYDYKPVELTLTAQETVDLRITRLAETYRMASFDSFNGRKILPPNLERFSMDVYFIDLRFLKHANAESILSGGNGPDYSSDFSGQINFGGVAFRCYGCKFDFSNLLENASQAKSSIGENSGFDTKVKIVVDRVLPATYFGDKAFGIAGFENSEDSGETKLRNTVGGALNLGPFTGGVNRVIESGRRALTNILGAPQRALNDALLKTQRRFEGAVSDALGDSPLSSRPFEKKEIETLLNERKTGGGIKQDVFPRVDNRTANPIKNDIFPGVDTRKANPIKRDEFTGVDVRKAAPIRNDVFPGVSSKTAGKINQDVFPGDTPVLTIINQRKTGGKINSQNPYKQ